MNNPYSEQPEFTIGDRVFPKGNPRMPGVVVRIERVQHMNMATGQAVDVWSWCYWTLLDNGGMLPLSFIERVEQ